MERRCKVIYFSQTQHTQTVAREIATQTGGELIRLKPIHPYPEVYRALVDRARQEISQGIFPQIQDPHCNPEDYDILYVGSPNWCGQIVPPLAGFLKSCDLTGKTIAPFVTHGGGGSGRSAEVLRSLCPGANIAELLEIKGDGGSSLAADVAAWRQRNGL